MLIASPPPTAPAPSKLPSQTPTPTSTPTPTPVSPNTPERSWTLHDETTATGAIVDAIDGARSVVNAEFFGIADAGKGAQLTSALERAARRGVEVNVIADWISAVAIPVGSFQRMKSKVEDAGGTVILTSRGVLPGGMSNPGRKHVDHRKVVTVDGTTSFVGGMNFLKLTDAYRDTMVRLTGAASARLAADQLARWRNVGGTVSTRHAESVRQALDGHELIPSDPRELRIIANAPDTKRYEISDGYLDLIRGAKRRLWIASPGISDRAVIREIQAAAQRGVDVRMVAPGTPPLGVPVVNWVGRSHLADIVKQGGQAWEIPEVLHRKAIIADDELILSSYNLTKRSREHDHEVGIRTSDPEFVAAIAGILEHDMSRSVKFDPGTHTGFAARLGDLIADRISY